MRIAVAAALLALTLCACATGPRFDAEPKTVEIGQKTRTATFEYLGSGGWLIRRGNDAILTSPFFTNPGLSRLFLRIAPNAEMVRKHIEEIEGGVDDVRAVLAGHAHYDHIMDLPEVAKYLPADAVVLGGETVCNSLGRNFPRQCIPVTDHAGTRYHEPRACPVGARVRVLPYFSEHAAHLWKGKLFNGHYSRMLDSPPRRPSLWREGETLAFLIDFLDEHGEVELRVYYNDSAPGMPYGLPDAKTLERPVDVAIFCVASYAQQPEYPDAYIREMNPQHVLLGHWESFFRSVDARMKPVLKTDVPAFLKLMPKDRFTLPGRHKVITVKY